MTAVRPVGKPLELVIVYGPAPRVNGIEPVKPGMPTVHCATLRLPIPGAGLMAILMVLLSVAPAESVTVTVNVAVPAVLDMPLKVIVPAAAFVANSAPVKVVAPAWKLFTARV